MREWWLREGSHVDNPNEWPGRFLDWLVILLVVSDTRVVVLDSKIRVHVAVLSEQGVEREGWRIVGTVHQGKRS